MVYDNGIYRELTPEEIAEMKAQEEKAEREYWANIPYKTAVRMEIRKRYDLEDELAFQRQKDKKPDEYAEYDAYCEQCKAYVKAKQAEVQYE